VADNDPHKAADVSESKALDPEEARARTFELLAEPSRFKRMHALCELLTGLSKDNWREVMNAFVSQTTQTGRRHDEEWFLLMEHVGEIAGADAFEGDGVKGDYQVQAAFSGFATGDSKGAIAWLGTQPPQVQQNLAGRLLSGVAETDPEQAFTLALAQPQFIWQAAMTDIVSATVQRGGFAAAEEMYKSIKARADVPAPVKDQVFYEVAQRKAFAAAVEKKPASALAWFDQYLGADSSANAQATQAIVGRAAKDDGLETLNWIEARADRFPAGQAPIAYAAAARSFQEQSPDQFTAWMKTNPDHPQHEAMAAAVVNALIDRSDLSQALHWAEEIHDPVQRGLLEARFKRHGVPFQK
jgi:hypothetical protein